MAYQRTQALLKKQGLAPHKKLGQNFLVHRHTAERIVDLAAFDANDTVIEVGVGLGALTTPLAEAVREVIGIEADSGIIRLHDEQKSLPDNVTLIHQDILKTDFADLAHHTGGRLHIIANLPYSISSPFIFRLIDHAELVDSAVVMVQKEVALRLMAKSGTKEYGIPTVLLSGCAEVKPLLLVKPSEFHPQPKIDSMVIRISFFPIPERVVKIGKFNRSLFKKIVKAAFAQRRKTLLNAMTASPLGMNKQMLDACIREVGISPGIRAEKLEMEDFVHLTRKMEEHL